MMLSLTSLLLFKKLQKRLPTTISSAAVERDESFFELLTICSKAQNHKNGRAMGRGKEDSKTVNYSKSFMSCETQFLFLQKNFFNSPRFMRLKMICKFLHMRRTSVLLKRRLTEHNDLTLDGIRRLDYLDKPFIPRQALHTMTNPSIFDKPFIA